MTVLLRSPLSGVGLEVWNSLLEGAKVKKTKKQV
jgi:hypothetical protein